jgi:2-oxo-4-hydroxy-4-carboxy-5-ureidoimidazoline decarboxylase
VPRPAALDRFNQLPAGAAERELLACCASSRWAGLVTAARPYDSLDAFRVVVDAVLGRLTWADVEQALAAHPRLGERAAGADRAAEWSRGEQAGVAAADADTRAELAAGNAAYERRFGHVYLACATGRAATDLLDLLCTRLGNDPAAEREVVRAELGKITWIRLAKLLDAELPAGSEGTERERGATTAGRPEAGGPDRREERASARVSTHVLDATTGQPAAGVAVRLDRQDGPGWTPVGAGVTGADGRLRDWLPAGAVRAGVHRLAFDTGGWFAGQHRPTFYPEVVVVFSIADPAEHHHVPLLLSPFGYSTYRGS